MTDHDVFTELKHFLDCTKPEELDCDRFLELLAPWLDGGVDSPELRALLEHHRQLCAECREELELLQRVL